LNASRIIAALLLVAVTLSTQACKRKATPGTLVVAEESSANDFDPRYALDAYSSRIINLLYSGLVSQDTHASLVPDLAERWEIPDPRTYVFHLRKGVTFHDGRPLTAEDVVYTFQSIVDPALASPKADSFKDMESVEAVDSYTVRFHLTQPFSPFLQSLTEGIIPRGAGRELSRRPVGSGPFKLIDFEPGSRTVLGAFSEYYGGQPKIRRLIIKAVPNDTTRVLELRKGSVQLLINSVPPDALQGFRANPKLQVIEQPGLNVSYLGFNMRDPNLAQLPVRQAIAYAIDRERIIRNLLDNGAVTTSTILAPLLWAHAATLPATDYDPARARAILDAAGFQDPDGKGPAPRLKLTYKTSTNPLRRRIADAIAQELGEVGIAVEVRSYEFATFFEDIKKGNFQLFSLVWVGITEPDAFYNIFHSRSIPPAGANRGAFEDAQIDAWIEAGRRTIDPGERKRLYVRIQERLAEELPYVTLWVQNDVAVASTRLKHFTLFPGGDYTGLVRATLEDAP
jgi:peptide/nickel transport system substrate-binding protein